MPHERLRPSFVFDEERLKQLKQIVPEAFADGKINWDLLKQSLGERLEEEGAETEHFGLFWPGKREARKLASIPSKGALIPVKGEGINENTTRNIFIEGENLEVLKLLQKSYVGKIKMIYIDPPYNTGSDLIYDDNFAESLEEYLKYTGQMDEEGRLLTTNKIADGRFHSKWLNMMYPRLRLARNLLSDEGVILISIDDNEAHNLKEIMNEIFGEENFVAQFVVIRSEGGGLAKQAVIGHDYVIIFAKQLDNFSPLKRPKEIRGKIIEKNGRKYWIEEDWLRKEFGKYGTCLYEEIEKYKGKQKKIEIDEGLKSGIYQLIKKDNGKHIVGRLRALDEDASKFYTVLKHLNANGVDDLSDLGLSEIFSYPKPISLIKELVLGATMFTKNKHDLILDFFSGSSTTAQAVLIQNSLDHGNRQFILVQMPEQTEKESVAFKAGYKTIADIGKERIRRVISKAKKEGKIADIEQCDLGFRVMKLEKSNFKQWQNYKGKDAKELTSLFKEHEIPLVDGWKPENLLIEVMLQEGFPLDSEIAELKEHKKNAVMQVKSEFCEHKLMVCFDKKIYQETINALDIQGEDIFVCLDSALSDEQKITLSDKGFLKTI